MMDKNKTINMCVTHAGYKYIGHYRRGYLDIVLQNGSRVCGINPKNEFDLFDLFLCFGEDSEDGRWLSDIVGKYCRVTFDEEGKVRMIRHIVNDNVCWWEGKSDA